MFKFTDVTASHVYHGPTSRTPSYAWFPALRFHSSVQIESSSILSVPVASMPGALLIRKRGQLARQPTGPASLLTIRHAHSPYTNGNGNGITATALRNGVTDTVLRIRLQKQIRMKGNVTLETRP